MPLPCKPAVVSSKALQDRHWYTFFAWCWQSYRERCPKAIQTYVYKGGKMPLPGKPIVVSSRALQNCIGTLSLLDAGRVTEKAWQKLDKSCSNLWLLGRVRTETNQNKICFGCVLVCFGVSNLYQNNWNKQNCFKTNRNNPKFSKKYQNKLSIKLFRLVFCLFRFNQNMETLCFGIEAKQPKHS